MSVGDEQAAGPGERRRAGLRRRCIALVERLPILYLAAAAIAVFYLCEDEHVAVHIAWYRDNLPFLTYGDGNFGSEELLKQFRNFGGWIEFRARFLTYFFLTLDHYLRFFLYQHVRIPTGLSILYVPELVSVFLFYELVKNITGHRISSLLGTAFYVTSIGFTSGLSLMFMPGKPMTNVVFVVIAYLCSEMWKRDCDRLFIEQPVGLQMAVLVTMFLGFNFDEGAFFAPVIALLLFPSLFWRRDPRPGSAGRNLRNILVYLLPVLCFLLFVLLIVPRITRAFYGYDFDFIATVLGTHDPRMHEADYGLAGRFTLATLYANFLALVGTIVVPWWLDPGIAAGDRGVVKELWLALLVAAALALPRLTRYSGERLAYRALLLLGLYILFSALLNGRHGVVVDGFYYGSAIAVFTSLTLALACHAAALHGPAARRTAIVLAALPIGVQIGNAMKFERDNQRLYDALALEYYAKSPADIRPLFAALDPHRGVSEEELDWIWRLWKEGKWDELRSASISPGAVYLVAELRRMDQLKGAALPSGLLGAETISR
jgi:hypothetical protein